MNPDIYGESSFLRSNIEHIETLISRRELFEPFLWLRIMLKENWFLSVFLGEEMQPVCYMWVHHSP